MLLILVGAGQQSDSGFWLPVVSFPSGFVLAYIFLLSVLNFLLIVLQCLGSLVQLWLIVLIQFYSELCREIILMHQEIHHKSDSLQGFVLT